MANSDRLALADADRAADGLRDELCAALEAARASLAGVNAADAVTVRLETSLAALEAALAALLRDGLERARDAAELEERARAGGAAAEECAGLRRQVARLEETAEELEKKVNRRVL